MLSSHKSDPFLDYHIGSVESSVIARKKYEPVGLIVVHKNELPSPAFTSIFRISLAQNGRFTVNSYDDSVQEND